MTEIREDYKENKYYKKYLIQKEKIVSKYSDVIDNTPPRSGPVFEPPYTEKERNRHRKYLKEISNLLFKNNGNFQKFMWDTLSEVEKLQQEQIINGRKNPSPYRF
jgi:hypothetical protein